MTRAVVRPERASIPFTITRTVETRSRKRAIAQYDCLTESLFLHAPKGVRIGRHEVYEVRAKVVIVENGR